MSNEQLVQYVATGCFALAILHTFSVKLLQKLAHRYPDGSVGENFLHLLAEVEVVFGIWAGLFILFSIFISGTSKTISEIEHLNFKEALFVFVIMTICATQPILYLCEKVIRTIGRILPLNANLGFYCATLVIGPLLGSFITEPAAMTVTALILLKNFYQKDISDQLRYATLGLLFVNVSIGGTLTPYAAPPVLMVAGIWNWDLTFMFIHFGWKAIVAIVVSTGIICFRFRREISEIKNENLDLTKAKMSPMWVILLHLVFLIAIVKSSHYTVLFMGLFMFFLGVASVTKEYQSELKIKESLLVGFFLGGLVVLGGYQSWWLQPLLSNLTAASLYLGAMSLTAITDNAAITYLGSQVAGLSEVSKYVLVAGSVVGGGLTVIANAPNPAGYSTLNASFGTDGISPTLLFRSALLPTFVAALCFWFF